MTWEELKERLLKEDGWQVQTVVNMFKIKKAERLIYKGGLIELDSRGVVFFSSRNKTPDKCIRL